MRLVGRRSVESNENPKGIAAMWAFALFWSAASGVMFYVWAFLAHDIFASVIAGLFLLIGLAMVLLAARKALDYAKFGAVRFTPAEPLAQVGTELEGRLELPAKAAAAGELSAELACIRVRYMRGGEDGISTRNEDAWSERRRFPIQRSATGGTALVLFPIPFMLFPTDVPADGGASPAMDFERDYHKWELRIAVEVEGLDLDRTFDIPVLPAASDAAAVARTPDERVRRPAARSVTGVNPVTVTDRASESATQARGRRIRWLAAAGFVLIAVVGPAVFLQDFRQSDRPPDRVSSPATVEPLRHPRAASAMDLQAGPEATEFIAPQTSEALSRLREAVIAQAAIGRQADAARLFQEALAAVERDHGATSPLAALVHHRMSVMYLRQQRHVEQEQALLRALAILEQYSAAEVKSVPGMKDHPLDIEMIAVDLGYAYWEQRRYDQAFVWYQRAYNAALGLDESDYSRNRRLAVSSAGLMASACTQGKWDIADRAMAELKERMVNVDPELRKWLDYWVRTGEPRLAARKC